MIPLLEFVLASWTHFLGTLALMTATAMVVSCLKPIRIIINRHDD